MFCIGQCIVYGNSGICRVEEIGTLHFIQNSSEKYYTLRPLYTSGNARIYVPVKSNIFMRNVMTKEEAFLHLEHLKNMEVKVCRLTNQNLLADHYRELIAIQDIDGYLRLFKEIFQKERAAKDNKKKLGQVDLRFYKMAERMLSEELSVVFQETQECSKKRLYDAASAYENEITV